MTIPRQGTHEKKKAKEKRIITQTMKVQKGDCLEKKSETLTGVPYGTSENQVSGQLGGKAVARGV